MKFKFWLITLSLVPLFLFCQDYQVIKDEVTLPILTPSLAQAKIAKIRLKNGVEAFIVSDPNVDKSSAAMTVRVGSFDEPKEYPGLAHFLEHLLFLGTKKYPKESEYNSFINEHGGITNAFTSNNNTSYMFSIDNNAFIEALDRFSNFFKEPLFNPSGVARELQAIDQEYAKNRENDNVREIFVLKELTDPTHPFHAFNSGNSSTLNKVSQDLLRNWYQKNYSANLMRLAVVSTLPLETLVPLVVENFQDIPNKNLPRLDLDQPIFSKNYDGKIVYIEPIKNIRSLTLLWDLPKEFAHKMDEKPDTILCYILGHEGQKSLLAHLKKEHLAESLSCGGTRLGPNNYEFYINIGLTDQGVQEFSLVIEKLFQTIALLKTQEVPPYIYEEVKTISTTRYQYQPREDPFYTVMQYAEWLAYEDVDSFPIKSQVIQKFDPPSVYALLDQLTPEKSHINLIAPSSMTGVNPDKQEAWNGVRYAIRPIPLHILAGWQEVSLNPEIDIPVPNPYLPKNLNLLHEKQTSKRVVPLPEKILDNEKGKIFFAADKQFLTPQVGWVFEFLTPQIKIGDPSSVVMSELFVRFVKESLDAESYPAALAGLTYGLTRGDNGIKLEINGFNDKAHILFQAIISHLKELMPTQESFKTFKASLLREYQNFYLDPPLKQASEVLRTILYKDFSTSPQKAAALKKVTFEKFQNYIKTLFEKVYVQGVLFGNMTVEQAKTMAEVSTKAFNAASYPLEEHLKVEIINLPNDGPYYLDRKIKVEGNACILCVESPHFSLKGRAAGQVLMQAMSEPFFGELRTRQQTGYIVFNNDEELERHLFSIFAVQSNSHESRDLLARFELFIERYLQEIASEVSEERFTLIKEALVITLANAAKNIEAMATLIYTLAFKYDGDFDWIEKRIASLKDLTYEDFLQISKETLGRQNRRRVAILARGTIPIEKAFSYQRLNGPNILRAMSTYSSSR